MKRKLLKRKEPEWAALALFAAAYAVVAFFHEPWFDEAQAWQIAKCAGLWEILFEIPHYEGHPPLWHLILAVPAKLGVPFEIGLKATGLIVSVASAWLLVFYSRLPRFLRLSLPFSYFFFYQFGVVVRPYGLMLLIILLLGMVFPMRNERPWRVFVLLLVLCALSAHGILLAGGISLCIVWELWREKGFKKLFAELFRDPRSLSLLILLAAALALIAEIMPREDTYATYVKEPNPFLLCLICALFTFPGDCFLTTSSWFRTDTVRLQEASINVGDLTALCLLGLVIWILIICASSKKNLKFLLIPYLLFACFSAKVYSRAHHIGIAFLLMLFWAVLLAADGQRFEIGNRLLTRISSKESDKKLLRRGYLLFCTACLAIPIVWTAAASINDIRFDYWFGRKAAGFLQEAGLESASILGAWQEDDFSVSKDEAEERYIDTEFINVAIPINAYFDRNLFFNLNDGLKEKAYVSHRLPDAEQCKSDVARWRAAGAPDVIVGLPKLELVYNDELSYKDYQLAAWIPVRFIWKASYSKFTCPIFLRNDLLEEYGLEPLTGGEYDLIGGLRITDEMREAFENGIPIEEILKPYLDVIFGEEG